jgi:hypothetical protein
MEYNPNPTVYRPTHRQQLGKEGSLWIIDGADEDEESDEPEPIDREEIFGS